VLIDFDHFSCDTDKSSEAAGWIEELAARDSGLWGKCRWSDTGEAALKGGRYRLFSPVLGFTPRKYTPGERVEPTALLRGALTNDPRFKGMLPISNRDGDPVVPAQPQPKTKLMKDLNKALGLVEDAPEASALAALTLIKNRATEAEGLVATLTAERDTLLGVQIERDLDTAGLKPGATREQWKAALVKNRADALPLLASLKGTSSAYSVTHNRGKAKTPEGGKADGSEQSLEQQRTAAVRDYQTRNRCQFQPAWDAVRAEKPELFAEEQISAE
jgi:phage I-like protein